MSAALSQYLNVVEELRGQGGPQPTARSGSTEQAKPNEVDDWESPWVDPEQADAAAASSRSPRSSPDERVQELEATVEGLTEELTTLQRELTTLTETVRALHDDEAYIAARSEITDDESS